MTNYVSFCTLEGNKSNNKNGSGSLRSCTCLGGKHRRKKSRNGVLHVHSRTIQPSVANIKLIYTTLRMHTDVTLTSHIGALFDWYRNSVIADEDILLTN
jgi:hypothetical protein